MQAAEAISPEDISARKREVAPQRVPDPTPHKIELFAFKLREPEFTLDEAFLAQFAGRQPDWGPVGYVTYKRTYARKFCKCDHDDCSHPIEEYWQTCQRVVEGVYQIQQRHCQQVHTTWDSAKAQRSAQTMYRLMWEFKWLPPGRGLWMMGTDFMKERGSAALNNCAFVTTANLQANFAEPFAFLMDMSMLGVGVGSDTRGAGTVKIQRPVHSGEAHIVSDTREGWVAALSRVLNAYAGRATLPDHFDYSKLREFGAPIKGFGGVAAGAEPLRQLIEVDIPSVLDPLIDQLITKTAIVDVHNFVGKCVIAGNVRRSAEIMFGDDSDEFLELKNPEQYGAELKDRRWASNNSVFAKVGMDYSKAASCTAVNGEPGYLWLDNVQRFGRMIDPPNNHDARAIGANPCVEQSLENNELCTLVETFIARHDSYEDYELTLKMAYLYAKTVTLVPTHNPRTNAVMMRNRRIGTSMSGIVQAFQKFGRREVFNWADRGYRYLRDLDRIYSEWLAVRMSIKRTSVKPSGTVSKLCGATSGVHYPPAEFYIQRIRFAIGSSLLAKLQAAGYPSEPCLYSPNTIVVEFPVHEKHFYKAESDVSLWEQLSNAAQMQRYWADNQVSCTVKFDREKEGKDIAAALELYEDQLKGISFLPHAHGYEQAPWEPITEGEYRDRAAALKPLVLNGDIVHEVTERFCDGDSCTINI